MTSFAGYPLMVDGRLVGVVALFARHPLSDETLDVLAATAEAVAVGIDRDRASQDRERLLGQLDSQRSLMEAVIQQMPSGLIVGEAPSGRLVLANRRVDQILRQGVVDDGEPQEYGSYAAYHADGRRYTSDEWPLTRAIRSGEVVVGEEIGYQLGDGTWATLETSAAPVRDSEGRVVASVVTFHDVTERRRSARRLAAQYAATKVLSDNAGGLGDAAAPLLEAVGEALEWDAGAIWEVDGTGATLRLVDTWHRPGVGVELDRVYMFSGVHHLRTTGL